MECDTMIETSDLGFLRIALPELAISLGNPQENRRKIESAMQEAHQNSCHWVLFPAMVMTGTSIGDLFYQEKILRDAKEQLIDLAKASQAWQCMANIGFPFVWQHRIYACQAVIGQGRIWSIQPQSLLSGESRAFSTWKSGDKFVISIGPWLVPLGTQLLEEEQTGLTIRILQGHEGFQARIPDLIDSPASIYLWSDSREATASRALQTTAYLEQISRIQSSIWAYTSPGKGESSGDVVYDGYRTLCETGSSLSQTNLNAPEDFMVSDVHYRKVQLLQRKTGSMIRELREDATVNNRVELPRFTHTALAGALKYPVVKNPWLPTSTEERQHYCSELFRLQVRALARRLEHTGSTYAVLGVSGGLDSTLALLVATEAMRSLGKGSEQVFAVTMPGFGTSGRTYANALSLMKSLQVTQREISIVAACEQHFKDIDQPLNQHDVTFENAQARERTQILMDLANQINGLVVGTGDLSEIALGWCTYNGDQMSMYNPNHSLTKTMIREVVAQIAMTSSNSVLSQTLEDVLQTPVSPELLPSLGNEFHQKTEEALGPYEIHDFYLYQMAVCGLPPRDLLYLVQRAFPEYTSAQLLQWLKIFYRRFLTQQFKRSPSADGARVTSFSLSPRGDWQMPSDLQIQNWLQELEF
jgi:NAD+ synthase (glutamine-hydrolysing)